jgi:alpha-1,3-rhamnosyl/mannosyltransferase
VHDLPPLRFHDEGTLPRWSVTTARDARLIICPSAFAADEAATLLGAERIRIVPNGVARHFFDAAPFSVTELAALGIEGPFVLHAGGATRRKNLEGLAAAWREVAKQIPGIRLALVGPPDSRRDQAFSGSPRTVRLGHRHAGDVARLMTSAALVVVPSTYEGFGLPALEAMAAGVPVLAARAGALPEVCGDAALLAGPDPGGLAAGIQELVEDADLRGELVKRGRERARDFTWERSARGHLEAYGEAFGHPVASAA